MNKPELRNRCEQIRDAIPPDEKDRLDCLIETHLLTWDVYRKAKIVFCYVSFRSEVSTWGVIRHARAEGKVIAVPKINLKTMEMKACIVFEPEKDLKRGAYGIMEPSDPCREPDYSKIDLIIAPGLAFTPKGERLGYGGGFYDRFIKKNTNITICSPVYERFILNDLPVKEHDRAVDYLITETGVKRTR